MQQYTLIGTKALFNYKHYNSNKTSKLQVIIQAVLFFIHYFQFTHSSQLISQELYKLQNSYTSKTYQNYSTL